EDREPVLFVVEADHDIAHLPQDPCNTIILTNLLSTIVGRPIDIDGRVLLAIEEVRLRVEAGDPVLRIGRWPEHELVHHIEPALFELAIAALPQGHHALRPRAGAPSR